MLPYGTPAELYGCTELNQIISFSADSLQSKDVILSPMNSQSMSKYNIKTFWPAALFTFLAESVDPSAHAQRCALFEFKEQCMVSYPY